MKRKGENVAQTEARLIDTARQIDLKQMLTQSQNDASLIPVTPHTQLKTRLHATYVQQHTCPDTHTETMEVNVLRCKWCHQMLKFI